MPENIDTSAVIRDNLTAGITIETRKNINMYLFNLEKVQSMLPHLNITDIMGRPKTYAKHK